MNINSLLHYVAMWYYRNHVHAGYVKIQPHTVMIVELNSKTKVRNYIFGRKNCSLQRKNTKHACRTQFWNTFAQRTIVFAQCNTPKSTEKILSSNFNLDFQECIIKFWKQLQDSIVHQRFESCLCFTANIMLLSAIQIRCIENSSHRWSTKYIISCIMHRHWQLYSIKLKLK